MSFWYVLKAMIDGYNFGFDPYFAIRDAGGRPRAIVIFTTQVVALHSPIIFDGYMHAWLDVREAT